MMENTSFQSENDDKTQTPRTTWIFGYGSLIWNPDFPFEYCVVGHVDGFVRRFWQGSTWHRGKPEKPGRVVTLVEEEKGQVWGVAYRVSKENVKRALGNLHEREIAVGGYKLLRLRFSSNEIPSHTFVVLVYVATPQNPHYLGPATPEQLANEIAFAEGHAGLNVEYLIRLADFMREKVPDCDEEHLFQLEKLVRKELGLCAEATASWTQLKSNFIK
ncbi:putative glutathione-specific gamma-glutamylcyclotransferase 2 [Montipora capricornis]|uniref:putative glutathione-specific gamma-glutamylcyclotransferase 2 n=1 Tax=Montipora capricornis TaxID=246305 RepID=UPI0035F1ABD0